MPEEKKTWKFLTALQSIDLSQDIVVKVSLAAGLVFMLALMFPRGEAIELDYKVGAVWAQKDLIAPFSFPVNRDEREYAAEVAAAKEKVYPVFERDERGVTRQTERLTTFFKHLRGSLAARNTFLRNQRVNPGVAGSDSLKFLQALADLEIPFSADEWAVLAQLEALRQLEPMQQALEKVIREVLQVGVLDRLKNTLNRDEIALRRGSFEEIIPSSRLVDRNDLATILDQRLRDRYPTDSDTLAIAYKIGIMMISPNILFDKNATELAIRAAVDAIPRTIGFVQENERIVSKHERITPEIKLKLESLRKAKAARGPESGQATQFLGTIAHVMIVLALYSIYLYLFRKKIYANNRRLALIAMLILLVSFFAYLTRELNVTAPIEYLIFVPAASMLLTIVFDSRVAFYGTVILAFLVAGIRGNDYSIALASLVAGALSVYTVRDMKNRTQIFRSLGFIFLGYAVSIVALSLERFEQLNVVIEQLTFALANAVVSPVLTYGLLIFVERVFNVTTDLTLIELAHFNHPLLRQLSERAPGTYHHSMTMANLAEAAALAVGANEVLARVGGYFHDIGKIMKPTYFVENQKGSRNRHDKIAPRMSSLIIAAHVKDGIALAREFDLPEEVIDCIPMHHGTTRMEFFYNKALKLAEGVDDTGRVEEIKEQDYRYPGPKPQTKETGILMLADAVEATARTLEDPSPPKLEAIIDEIIRKRFEEGELDECPLTLKDLTKIKAAFLSILVGIYHTRVKYPDQPQDQPEKKKLSRQGMKSEERLTPDERLTRTIKQIDRG